MNVFGLTGNIGCGKSTVASLLSQHGDVSVIDCDKIAKNLIASGTYRQEINTLLGEEVFYEEEVDFTLMAEIIFQDPEKKKALEALIHPLVWKAVEREAAKLSDQSICIIESAIIYETSTENKFGAVIVATCEEDEQIRRLRENRHMSEDGIVARLESQISQAEKVRRAQFVIKTNCSLEELKERVHTLYETLKKWKEKNNEYPNRKD